MTNKQRDIRSLSVILILDSYYCNEILSSGPTGPVLYVLPRSSTWKLMNDLCSPTSPNPCNLFIGRIQPTLQVVGLGLSNTMTGITGHDDKLDDQLGSVQLRWWNFAVCWPEEVNILQSSTSATDPRLMGGHCGTWNVNSLSSFELGDHIKRRSNLKIRTRMG